MTLHRKSDNYKEKTLLTSKKIHLSTLKNDGIKSSIFSSKNFIFFTIYVFMLLNAELFE